MAAGSETLYQVLGVEPTATDEEIRAAYGRLALEYQPDRHRQNPLAELAAEKLAAVNAAHEVLSNPGRRAAYDAELAALGGVAAAPEVRREVRALAVLLRAVSVILVVLFLARMVPLVWRALRELVVGAGEALAGTPAVLAGFVVVAGVGITLAWRRRRRQRRSRPPG